MPIYTAARLPPRAPNTISCEPHLNLQSLGYFQKDLYEDSIHTCIWCNICIFPTCTSSFVFGDCSRPNSSSIHLRMTGPTAGSPMCIAFGTNLQQTARMLSHRTLWIRRRHTAPLSRSHAAGVSSNPQWERSRHSCPIPLISLLHQAPGEA